MKKKKINELDILYADKKIEKEFEEWKKKYKQKSVPKRLNKKEKEKWIEDAWLYYDEKRRLLITGAARILLWLCYVEGGWKKYIEKLIREKRYRDYLECKKYLFREKLFGINLLAKINKKNSFSLIMDN